MKFRSLLLFRKYEKHIETGGWETLQHCLESIEASFIQVGILTQSIQ